MLLDTQPCPQRSLLHSKLTVTQLLVETLLMSRLWLGSALGCVQAVFQRWRDRSQSTAQQRVQMERAAQHHRLRLLQEMMAQWKAHHLGFIRKMVRHGHQQLSQIPVWQ